MPKLRRAGLFESLAFLLTSFKFARHLTQISPRNNVVTIKHAAGFVAADAHRHALAHAGAYHVSHRCPAEIVEDENLVFQFVTGPITLTIRAVFLAIDALIAVRTYHVAHARSTTDSCPRPAELDNKLSIIPRKHVLFRGYIDSRLFGATQIQRTALVIPPFLSFSGYQFFWANHFFRSALP